MVKGLSVQEKRLRENNIYIYMLIYIFTYRRTCYVYTLCFLVHTHMHTHNGTNASLCPSSPRGKMVQSPQFTAQKNVDLRITKSLGYDGSGGVPTVPPQQSRQGNSLTLETSQETISVPVLPF